MQMMKYVSHAFDPRMLSMGVVMRPPPTQTARYNVGWGPASNSGREEFTFDFPKCVAAAALPTFNIANPIGWAGVGVTWLEKLGVHDHLFSS